VGKRWWVESGMEVGELTGAARVRNFVVAMRGKFAIDKVEIVIKGA
jgi:hypothetical protein